MNRSPEICVLGGAGMMGKVIIKCLFKADSKIRLTIADRRKPSDKLPARACFKEVNLLHHSSLVRLLKGHQVVINSTSHHFNLPVMKAALEAGVHYLDLGGLFHFTRKQLKWNKKFQKKNLLAVLGMGCAPGVANLLAVWGAEGMEQVREIHVKVGDRNWNPPSSDVPYAAGTIREELVWKPAVFRAGRYRFEKPQSGAEWFFFARPVGRQKVFRTIHSEVATLPRLFPGVRECSFKIGFPEEMIDAVLHPSRKKRIPVKSAPSVPVQPCDAEVTAVVVMGTRKGRKISRTASYIAFSSGRHSAGDWNTAWPPALVSLMIARGELSGMGVFPPEKVVPFMLLFKRLKKFGFRFVRSER